MATRQAANSEDIYIKLDGVQYKLNITTRHNDGS